MFKKVLFILLLSFSAFAQYEVKKTIPTDADLDIEDYWETELSPITDQNEVVSFIHNDSFNYFFIDNIPGGNPLAREISVNSFYGARLHPIHKILKFHRGIDLKGVNGEIAVASGNGKVIETGFKEDLGNYIKISHKYGFESIYGHLSKISVKKGQDVKKGQTIGKVGQTGKVTGPHLHYTLKKNGEYFDPFDFLFMNFQKNW